MVRLGPFTEVGRELGTFFVRKDYNLLYVE